MSPANGELTLDEIKSYWRGLSLCQSAPLDIPRKYQLTIVDGTGRMLVAKENRNAFLKHCGTGTYPCKVYPHLSKTQFNMMVATCAQDYNAGESLSIITVANQCSAMLTTYLKSKKDTTTAGVPLKILHDLIAQVSVASVIGPLCSTVFILYSVSLSAGLIDTGAAFKVTEPNRTSCKRLAR
jgi:hypothetical protein